MTSKNLTTEKAMHKAEMAGAAAAGGTRVMPPGAMAQAGAAPEVKNDAWKGLPDDSQLISFGDRFTFTFAQGREVGSIHFDRGRGEIFYKGHNIRNMEMEDWQLQILEGLRKTLATDAQGKAFAADYARTLDKIVMERRNRK